MLADATQLVAPLFTERKVAFRVICTTDSAVLTGSRKALAGALVNLLENALQACAAGGKVTLTASAVDGQLCIGVVDTGCGIAPEIQVRVFEPFFTTRGQGTGLGLAIALGVARAHGGTIEVSSAAGEGSEFAIMLPIKTTVDLEN